MTHQPSMQPAGRQYFPALDGLRGLAILVIVIYHNFGFIEKYFFFGWLAVDLFFVLSGFLITDILLKELGSKNYLRNFYVRRLLRIFPLYYLSLVIFLIVLPQLNTPLRLDYYTDNQVWIWTYLQNWLYVFKNPTDTSSLNHLWSVAVEEQFYLFWPLVILLVKKPKHLLICIAFLLAAVFGLRLWAWMNHVSGFAYYNLYTFTRIDGICIGCTIALMQRINPGFLKKNTAFIVLSFAILNFAFFFVNRYYEFTFPYLALVGYTTFAMVLGLLVNQAVTRENKWINLFLDISFLKFFGRISYGFYLFHWPLYLWLSPYLSAWLEGFTSGWVTQFIASLISTAAAILLSILSFNFFEKYFLRLKHKFT